ncbi:MAG: Gfo/Idh/MocA family oxidoreductase [Myxococcota bacterium]
MLRVALVGCGAMGARHARVMARDPGVELVVVDALPDRARSVADEVGARTADHVPHEIDAAVIATPTTTHAAIAGPLLARGVWCLIEKPLAHAGDAARALDSPRCAVGHVERFNPAIRAAGGMRPRVIEARRVAPPTGRGLDVDVVLDLMIHDLDLVLRWGGGAEVAWIDASGARDTVSVKLRTTAGMTATLLASRVATQRERIVRCYEVSSCTVLDLVAGRATRDGVELPLGGDRDALTCQWSSFATAVRGNTALGSSGSAIRAVELAERIRAVVAGES